MGRLLFAVFMIVPLIEIAVFILLGNAIGLWPTLAGVLIMAVVGTIVLRVQGLALIGEIRGTVAQGLLPARALADAMMVAIAGILMLTPGYFTDVIGLLLLVPAVRSAFYAYLRSRVEVVAPSPAGYPPGGGFRRGGPGTIDLDEGDWRPR